MAITLTEIGWAAGFYEGEGSVTKYSDSENLMLSITQKDQEPLLKLQKLFGGDINFYNGYYYWRLYGAKMRGFILTIFTLLSQRRKDQILKHKLLFITPKEDMCPNGHLYTPRSFRWASSGNRVYRACKVCAREKKLRYREKIRLVG